MHEPIIPRGARQGPSQLKRTCSIFAYEDIKEVHKRRYLLQVMDTVFELRIQLQNILDDVIFKK